MSFTYPSIADFKTRFARDMSFGVDPDNSIVDVDIANAYQMSNVYINQGLFSVQTNFTMGYLLLSAHYLVMNYRASSQGVNGQFAWLEKSKAVDKIDASFEIPKRILDNPLWAIYSKTNYGIQYLALLLPHLTGQMFSVPGAGIVPRYWGWGGGWRWPN